MTFLNSAWYTCYDGDYCDVSNGAWYARYDGNYCDVSKWRMVHLV